MKVILNSSLLLVSLLAFPAQATDLKPEAHLDRICTGSDCNKELRRSIRLARSNSGDTTAFLAMAYATGNGVEQNTAQAIRYLRLGMQQRNPKAIYLMSDWLRNGFIVEQDVNEAARLRKLATQLNYRQNSSDDLSVGNRNKEVSCEQSGNHCTSIRPKHGASSLNKEQSGNK